MKKDLFTTTRERSRRATISIVLACLLSSTASADHIRSDDAGAIPAVELIAAWVSAGAPKSERFPYKDLSGGDFNATFETDILPLFNQPSTWFANQPACTTCHFSNGENSFHEMDLTSYEGIMRGGDVLSKPPGVPLFGQSKIGAKDYDWSHSKLKARLRNNRMPPGWPYDITETNRDGPCVEVTANGANIIKEENGNLKYGCDHTAVGLMEAWANAGAPEHTPVPYGGGEITYNRDIQPFLSGPGMWFKGSVPCTVCHFGNTESSFHEMDLTSYAGVMRGGDVLSKPPGVPLFGQSKIGATDFNWKKSKMNARLRNNRMPPGITFDITEANRDGPLVRPGSNYNH